MALLLALPVLWHGLLTFEARAARPALSNDLDYLIDTWETEDGLPENSATCMAQTYDGYLWFGTFNGLVRFDGVTFTVFNPRNTPQLPSTGIVNLHADRLGRLWISTYDGLVVRAGAKWRVFGKEQGWSNYFARTFAERHNGDLLITTFDGAVLEFANNRLAPLPEPPGTRGQGYFGGVDAADRWWVAQHGFTGLWDGQRWTNLISPADLLNLPPENVCATVARDGGWWLLLGRELRKYRGDAKIATVQLPEMPGLVWSLSEDSQGNVWICTQVGGVCRVSPEGRMRRWTKDSGLLASGTRFAFEDRERNVWVGTSGGGLLRFKPRRLQSFGFESGLTERLARSVAAHPDGTVLIATYSGGLFRLGETGLALVPFSERTNRFAYMQSVLVDRDGRIWAGTYHGGGLWVSGPQGLRPVPKEQVPGDNVLALFQDSRGRTWASDGEGVTVFDAGKNDRYGPEQGLPKAGVRCFAEDSAGVLWLSNAKGVFRLENDHFVEVRDDTNRSITEVGCLKTETDGTLWMGTMSDGLLRRKQGKLARIDAENGLPVASINGILEDGEQCFWMATSRGVVRVQRNDLESVADGRVARLNSQLLDLSDGLPSVECASGVQPTCARDARGRMWFATAKGVAMLDPARFLLNTNPPPVQIESVVYRTARDSGLQSRSDATERRIEAPFTEHLVLPAGSRWIEVHYTALGFTAPEKLRFQVRLEGQDSDWHDVGGLRLALFHDVPPGGYTFRVRAANNDGVWNEAGASLAFTVRPFFWQTAWFRGLLGAALVTAILVWVRRHTAKLDSRRLAQEAFTRQLISAQEAERARLARELHDDITQRLAVLAIDAGRIERAGAGAEVVGPLRGVREGLVRLSEDVHTLSYRLHSSLLEDLGLAEALKAECELFSHQESIPCDLKLLDMPISLPDETALCLFRVTQEALRNVARHARASAVEVTLRRLDDGLQLAIRDNGTGFDPSRKRDHVSLGLASMQERAHLLGGELDIESAPGHGTTIVAWVPLNGKET